MPGRSMESQRVSIASGYLELASELSSRLVSMAPEGVNDEIRCALRSISDFFAMDFCAIYKSSGNEDHVVLVHGMHARRTISASACLNVHTAVPQIFNDVLYNKQALFLRLSTFDDLPASAKKNRVRLACCGLESLLLIPISTSLATDYILLLASTGHAMQWTNEQLLQVRLLAEMLVNAMCRSGTQKALQRTTRDLPEAQRIYGLGSWEWDIGSGRIVAMDEVDRILGCRPQTQASFEELVQASDRHLLQRAIDNALCNNGSELLIEYRMRTHCGDMRIVRSGFEVADYDGGAHMLGTFYDVTHARRSEQELQLLRSQCWHADRVAHTGVLVASLAHELSQPLTAILSNAQAGLRFLSHEPLDRHEMQEILKDIVADNRRARHIIDALRGMIRGNKTERARINATDIAREVLVLLHSEFVVQQVEVKLACGGACFVRVDKTQIEQVLLNLILNSIESMSSKPAESRRIHLQVKRKGEEEVQISVSDTGVGIPTDQLDSVFEAFWTTKTYGLGMGLAICRSIIEAHSGRIWAECNGDRGAVFLVRLPLAD